MRVKRVDHSSFKLTEELSTEVLLCADTAEATDWLRSTGPTTLTRDG